MTKISKTVLAFILLGLILLASLDAIFREVISYKLIIVYLILLCLAPYAVNDAKVEKKDVLPSLFLVFSLIAVSAGQYIMSFHSFIWLWLGITFMAAGLVFAAFRPEAGEATGGEVKLSRAAEFMIFSGIMLLAFGLRFYDLAGLPAGVWYDEAQNGNEALNIIEGRLPGIWIARLTDMPAMFFYMAAAFMKAFGEDAVSMRYISALTGSLSVAAFYFLLRAFLKDKPLALAGALLLCLTRWHITFSRVAFLGMPTLMLEVLTLYFYVKIKDGRKPFYAIAAGAVMGLNFYSFSAAYFVPLIIAVHALIISLTGSDKKEKIPLIRIFCLFATALAVSLPLLAFAAVNPAIFTKRINDINILKDIKNAGGLEPLYKAISTHLLMFNFEGDYNGRHNLYKKPMLDAVSGALFAFGLFSGMFRRRNILLTIWLFVTLAAGMSAISVEAPQAYRILGLVPAVCAFMVIGLREIRAVLVMFNKKQAYFFLLAGVIIISAGFINVKQYFIEYPKEASTFSSFSPEANAIAEVLIKKSPEYYGLISVAKEIYGFYPWEQKVVCEFLTRKKASFGYINGEVKVFNGQLEGRKGVMLIVRPSDVSEIKRIEALYPRAVKEAHPNPHADENMFICYYVNKEDIKGYKVQGSGPIQVLP